MEKEAVLGQLRAVQLTARTTVKERRFRPVRYRDGVLMTKYPSAMVPAASGKSADRLEAKTLENFCWDYVPRPGDCVVDVGCGLGTSLPTFSRLVGPEGLVVGVEAHPGTMAVAERVKAENGLANVVLLQAAITDHEGDIEISTDMCVDKNTIVGASGATVTVPGMTLDQLVGAVGLQRIDLLKMNIEGAERQAIEGGARALAITQHAAISCHDFVADFEGGPDEMRTRAEVHAALLASGFRVREREDDRPFVASYLFASR
jgi:FkbM family methyltransferase